VHRRDGGNSESENGESSDPEEDGSKGSFDVVKHGTSRAYSSAR